MQSAGARSAISAVEKMIGLDTNVLARLFVDDDPVQARLARRVVAERSGAVIRVMWMAWRC